MGSMDDIFDTAFEWPEKSQVEPEWVWPPLSENMGDYPLGYSAVPVASILLNAWRHGCSDKNFNGIKLIYNKPKKFLADLIIEKTPFKSGRALKYFMKLIMVYNQWRPTLPKDIQ